MEQFSQEPPGSVTTDSLHAKLLQKYNEIFHPHSPPTPSKKIKNHFQTRLEQAYRRLHFIDAVGSDEKTTRRISNPTVITHSLPAALTNKHFSMPNSSTSLPPLFSSPTPQMTLSSSTLTGMTHTQNLYALYGLTSILFTNFNGCKEDRLQAPDGRERQYKQASDGSYVPKSKNRYVGHNIAAIAFLDGVAIECAFNVNKLLTFTQHAETRLMDLLTRKYDKDTLSRIVVFASLQPCYMCAGTMLIAGVKAIVWLQDDNEILDIVHIANRHAREGHFTGMQTVACSALALTSPTSSAVPLPSLPSSPLPSPLLRPSLSKGHGGSFVNRAVTHSPPFSKCTNPQRQCTEAASVFGQPFRLGVELDELYKQKCVVIGEQQRPSVPTVLCQDRAKDIFKKGHDIFQSLPRPVNSWAERFYTFVQSLHPSLYFRGLHRTAY